MADVDVVVERDPVPVRSRKRVIVGLLAAGLLVVGTVAVWRWRSVPDYVGTSRVVSISWSCAQSLEWFDYDHRDEDGSPSIWYFWGQVPLTPVGPNASLVTGTLRFDSADWATFTADSGGSVELRRVGPNFFMPAACAIR